MEKSRVFQFALGGFLCGVAAASFFILPAWTGWLVAATGALAILTRRPLALAVGVVSIAAAIGIWRTDGVLHRSSALWDVAADKPEVVLDGFVDGDFELTARGGKFPFRVMPVNERIIVYSLDWIRPRYGQELTLIGKLQQPTNNGDFDYVSYLAKDGIYAQMYFPQYGVPDQPLVLPLSTRAALAFGRAARTIRYASMGAISRAVPMPEAGYLAGILVGDKSDIPTNLKDAFARTGTSHILAISGYNITIVAGALAAALVHFGRRRAYWFTIAGIVVFTIMTGAGASVVRAAVMGILALTARHLGRSSAAGAAILLAAALMCVFNPLFLRWDIGFQLSFLALIGIVYLEPIIRAPIKRLTNEPFAVMAATTLSANVLVLPLILYDFGTLAVYTLPVNLLVLPLVPLAMALGFATAVAGLLVPLLGALVGQVAWLVAAIQVAIIRFAADLPYAALEIHIDWPVMLAVYVGLATWLISVYRALPEPTHNEATIYGQ